MPTNGTCDVAARALRWLARLMICLCLLGVFAAPAGAAEGEASTEGTAAEGTAAEGATTEGTTTQPPSRAKMISLKDQKNAPIPLIIDMLSRELKVNYLLPDQLTGTVTIKWNRDLPGDEALNILRLILDDEGYTLIDRGSFLIVKPKAGSEPWSVPTPIRDAKELSEGEEYVTAIVVLNYIEVQEVQSLLTQLKDKAALVVPLTRINALIIKDSEARVRYLMEIIDKLDVPGTTGIVSVVRVMYADAGKLADLLDKVLTGQGPSVLPEYEGVPGGAMPVVPPGAGIGQRAQIKIIPDTRLNSLIIVATERETEEVKKLIQRLDVPPPTDVFPVHTFQCKNQKAVDLAGLLENFSKQRPLMAQAAPGAGPARGEGKEAEVFFIADEATNKILVSASPLDWEVYEQVLKELDQPQPQVLVEVWIVEISSEDQFGLGVEWETQPPSGDARTGPSLQEAFGATSFGLGLGDVFTDQSYKRGLNIAVRSMTNTRITVGGKTYLIPNIDAYLKALSDITTVNVIASPKILTLNNEDAEVDIKTVIKTATSEISGVGADREAVTQYRDTDVGIKLLFTPQINADGFVIMDVDLTVSNVVGADVTDAGLTPPIAERITKNRVRVEDDHTIIISGLRRHDKTRTTTGVPVLGRIPLLGLLFRSSSTIDLKTNVMIFITPHIVTDTSAMEQVTQQLQGQDLELQRERLEIRPDRYRRLQRVRERAADRAEERGDETSVWER
jgi:general secretion pathway protein D